MTPRRIRVIKKPAREKPGKRRALIFKLVFSLLGIIFVVIISAVICNLSYFRISTLKIQGLEGIDKRAVEVGAKFPLIGNYFWFWPKDSVFYLSTQSVVDGLINNIPRIKEVDVSRSGLTSLKITIKERKPYGLWCTADKDKVCYFVDNTGLVFDKAPELSDQLFIKFFGQVSLAKSALGQNYLSPNIFEPLSDFLSWVLASGISINSFYVDPDGYYHIYMPGGGQILVSDKRDFDETFRNLQSLLKEKNLLSKTLSYDKSIDYIDLRFGEKIYIKRR